MKNKRKIWSFKIIAVLLPFLALLALEAGLRIGGYGYNLDLFIEDKQNEKYWVMNPDASKRFFTHSENAAKGNIEPFKKKKPENTFRIFVLGGSTAIGYPYMHNGSFHRWLQYRLMHTFPAKNFEVINLSMTAVNSYTVLYFGKEILEYEPDAVLVYTGHNEYYGAMGVASTSRVGGNPYLVRAIIALKKFRFIQLFSNTIATINGWFKQQKVVTSENLMKRMAAKQKIPYESEVFDNGLNQFRSNMSNLLQVFSKHSLPVFISTVVSNEKDFKPLISEDDDSLTSANYFYSKASSSYQTGNFKQAKKQFVHAKELDLLRFRAPQRINEIIRDLANSYSTTFLVKSQGLFERKSPHEIIGNETLLEHVHPNLYGYMLLSEAFYQKMKHQKFIANNWSSNLTIEDLSKEMPVTKVDSLRGKYEIGLLKRGWPFKEKLPPDFEQPTSFEEKIALSLAKKQISWNDAMEQLMNFYMSKKDVPNALKVAEAVILEYPRDVVFYNYAAKFAMEIGDLEKADRYYEKSFVIDSTQQTARNLLYLKLRLDKPQEAVSILDVMINRSSSTGNLKDYKQNISQISKAKITLQDEPKNVSLLNTIAENYLKINNKEIALRYINRSLRYDPTNEKAMQLLKGVQK